MDADTYQRLAMATKGTNGGSEELVVSALGLAGEAGEFADAVKKHLFRDQPLTDDAVAHLREELGDLAWYLALACDALGFELGGVLADNLVKVGSPASAGQVGVDVAGGRHQQ